LKTISEKVSEQLNIVPAHVRVLHHIRKTYIVDPEIKTTS